MITLAKQEGSLKKGEYRSNSAWSFSNKFNACKCDRLSIILIYPCNVHDTMCYQWSVLAGAPLERCCPLLSFSLHFRDKLQVIQHTIHLGFVKTKVLVHYLLWHEGEVFIEFGPDMHSAKFKMVGTEAIPQKSFEEMCFAATLLAEQKHQARSFGWEHKSIFWFRCVLQLFICTNV